MSVPQFYEFIDPVLRVLAEEQKPLHRKELISRAIARMNLSEDDMKELAGWKGRARGITKVRDRAAWGITYANKV